MADLFKEIKAVLFDLDGTLYLGDDLIAGADRAVASLRTSGRRVSFLTNKPIASPKSYADKLTRLGIQANSQEILTSVRLTCEYLENHHADAKVFVIGEDYLQDSIKARGFKFSYDPGSTDVVVISLDRTFEYSKLVHAHRAAQAGACIIATNPDMICPMPDEDIIDAGAWIAALEALMKRPIDRVLGKPSRGCADLAISLLGVEPQEVLMVGDRLETDIRMAREAGMCSALVLSGVTTPSDLEESQHQPDFVWRSVAELPEALNLS